MSDAGLSERLLAIGDGFAGVRLSPSARDQVLQAAVDVGAPAVRAGVIALELGHQTDVSEGEFGLVALPGDVEDDASVLPLRRVFREAEMAVDKGPRDLLSRNQIIHADFAAVEVLEMVLERLARFVGGAFDLFRPPSAHIVNG